MNLAFPLRSAFVALPLEDQAKWQFQALQESLRPFEDVLSFQNPQSPHLTLYFWKELMEIEYGQVTAQLPKIAAAAEPFTLRVTEAGTFGSWREDRVLFLEVAFSDELARLKKRCPWPNPPDQPFHPHITVARVRKPGGFAVVKKKVMKELKDCSFDISVDRFRLYAEVDGRKQTALEDSVFGISSTP